MIQSEEYTFFQTVCLVTGAVLGVGMLSTAWSMAGASILTSLIIFTVCITLNISGNMIYIHVSHHTGATTPSEIAEQLPGKLGVASSIFTTSALYVMQFGTLVAFGITFADCLLMVLPSIPRAAAIVGFSIVAGILCSIPRHYLAVTSILSMVTTIYIGIIMVSNFAETSNHHQEVCIFGIGPGTISMFPATCITTIVQFATPAYYSKLKNRSPAKFRKILIVSYGLVFILLTTYGLFPYFKHGQDVQSDVMKDFPPNIFGNVGVFGAGCLVLFCYPLNLHPMIDPLVDDYQLINGSATSFKRKFLEVITILGSMIVSLLVTDLGVVNVVFGAVEALTFIFVIPSLLALHFIKMKRYEKILVWLFMIFGSGSAFLGLVYRDNYASYLRKECWVEMSI